jgi:hypothetical protein
MACGKEGAMFRTSSLIAVCFVSLALCTFGRAQDSPSLGELARQAQKNKPNAPAKKVFTNDDFSSGSPAGSSSENSASASGSGTPGAPAKPGEPPTPDQALDHMEGVIKEMDSLDRPALAKLALEGVDRDFPGRSAWEEKLFAAKQVYVSQGRDFVRKARQMQASVEPAKDSQGTKDSTTKDQPDRMQSIVQYGARIEAAFQEVIAEGRDLATKASAK